MKKIKKCCTTFNSIMSKGEWVFRILTILVVIIIAVWGSPESSPVNNNLHRISLINVNKTSSDKMENKTEPLLNFNGDLEIGTRQPGERIVNAYLQHFNPHNHVSTYLAEIHTFGEGHIHYVRMVNDPNSTAVACAPEGTIGSSKKDIYIRIMPLRSVSLRVLLAYH